MGIGKMIRNFAVYGTITVGSLYALSSCENRYDRKPDINRMADKGLECTQKAIRLTEYGLDTLDQKIEQHRDYLRQQRGEQK